MRRFILLATGVPAAPRLRPAAATPGNGRGDTGGQLTAESGRDEDALDLVTAPPETAGMGWIGRKFDNLGSAVSGAGGGMGLSQAPAYTQAYLQRLGGHLDEARRTLDLVERGILVPELTPAEREQAVTGFADRVAELEATHAAIADASPLVQPLLMLRHGDSEIAGRAWEAFTPAIPIDAPSLIWTGVGVLIALLVYELFKSPAAIVRRRRQLRPR